MESTTKQITLVTTLLVLVAVMIAIASIGIDKPKETEVSGFTEFSSVDEIKEFLESHYTDNSYYGGGLGIARNQMVESAVDSAASFDGGDVAAPSVAEQVASDYSETNIQVKGVDEPDIVKNDGKYIYTVTNQKVIITNAYPANELAVVSEITFEGQEYPTNILLRNQRLIVITNHYEYIQTGVGCNEFGGSDIISIRPFPCGGYSKTTTHTYIYDIADKKNPELLTDLEIDGNLNDARMIDEVLYLMTTKNVQLNAFSLPHHWVNGERIETTADKVSHSGSNAGRYIFNTVTALNIETEETNAETFLIDYSRNLYVSQNNIYLTTKKSIDPEVYLERMVNEVYIPVVPHLEDEFDTILENDEAYHKKARDIQEILQEEFEDLNQDEIIEFSEKFEDRLEEFSRDISKELEQSVVHKIAIDELDIEYKGFGEVPGTPLNQFSMDEYDGYFRIATTTGNWRDTSLNHLYILDEELEIVGAVENLAEGERIYSARFLGDKAYMVTFRQVDPLYVIDTENPENPEVLGYLKITGFSSYLHPYDENHLLGIGQEASEQGRQEGVKISLFDISDFNNPKEKAKYVVNQGEWSHSEAPYDHKAVLFDRERELLVIPMSYNSRIEATSSTGRPIYEYENWQGAFVFNIDPAVGINLRGEIAHEIDDEAYYQDYTYIRRSLYMDDTLYTISDRKIKANDLDSLAELNEIKLPYEQKHYDYPIPVDSVAAVEILE